MGLLNQLGVNNGFTDFLGQHRSALLNAGVGFAGGRGLGESLAGAAKGLAVGAPQDDAYATTQKAEAERQKAITDQAALRAKYADFFAQNNQPDWSQAVADGLVEPGQAYIEWMQGKAPKAPIKASPGDVFVDPTTMQPVSSIPEAPPKPTGSMQEYEFAKSQGYDGTFQQYETDMKKAGATNIDFNQGQSLAAGYADRMIAANAILSDPKLLGAMTDVAKPFVAGVPVVGNALVGPEFQQAEQAQRDFVNAILRRESGAAIAPSEFESAKKQYFPQPYDGPDVIKNKAENRRIAIEGLVRAAGSNYAPPPVMGKDGVVDFSTYFGGQ